MDRAEGGATEAAPGAAVPRPRRLGWWLEQHVVWPLEDAADEWRTYAPDIVACLALLVVALLVRREVLPTDGLWIDDAVTAAGTEASLSDAFIVGSEHPGFIAGLSLWRKISGGGDAPMAYPALAAGALAPPALYLGLRACGFARSVSALLGAALVAAGTVIVYSGRVKNYTIDLLIVLAIMLALPRLARMRWTWAIGVAWAVAASLVSTFSGFALIALAGAGTVLLLAPTGDLRVRIAAIGAQLAASGAILIAEQGTYNGEDLEEQWKEGWDAFITWPGNPIDFGEEILVHLRRVAEVFPGGPAWLAMICALLAVGGIALAAMRGPQRLRARYVGLLIGAAFVGGLLGKLPFGPAQANPLSDGGRVTIWLVPVIALGLALVLQLIRDVLARPRFLRFLLDTVACAVAVALLVSALTTDQPAYPFPGPASAAAFVSSHARPDDAVLLPFQADYHFAAETDFEMHVEASPEDSIGFNPEFTDQRIHELGLEIETGLIRDAVGGARRVFVYYPQHPFNEEQAESRAELNVTLERLGLATAQEVEFEDATVQVWRPLPPGATAWNLNLSDLPAGWSTSTPSTPDLTGPIFDCLGILPPKISSRFAASTSRQGAVLVVLSELSQWKTSAAARGALEELRSARGASCVESATGGDPSGFGLPESIPLHPQPSPRIDYPSAALGGSASAGGKVATSKAVFFVAGRTLVLVGALSIGESGFPPQLLARLIETVAQRQDGS